MNAYRCIRVCPPCIDRLYSIDKKICIKLVDNGTMGLNFVMILGSETIKFDINQSIID